MKKFYVASRLSNAEMQRVLVAELVKLGHQLTYDWTSHGSVNHDPGRWSEVAWNETLGIMEADFVVVLLPGGQGTHVELGIALGAGKRTFVVGDDLSQEELGASYRCIFMDHPHVTRIKRLGIDGFPRPLGEVAADVVRALA